MSIENNASQSGQVTQVKTAWVAPIIQIIDMDAARFGTLLNGKDKKARS
jgi:hypothetical protein